MTPAAIPLLVFCAVAGVAVVAALGRRRRRRASGSELPALGAGALAAGSNDAVFGGHDGQHAHDADAAADGTGGSDGTAAGDGDGGGGGGDGGGD
jgi:hypothetical protein